MGIPMLPVLLAGVLALLAGAFFLWRGRLHGLADRRFVRRSATATAEVTDVVAVDVNRRDGDLQRVWHPVVRFTLPDGEVVEARTMYGSDPAPTRPGREELVRYDPSDPHASPWRTDWRARAPWDRCSWCSASASWASA